MITDEMAVKAARELRNFANTLLNIGGVSGYYISRLLTLATAMDGQQPDERFCDVPARLDAAPPAPSVAVKVLRVIANYENQATLDENSAKIMTLMAKAALSPDIRVCQDRINAALADRASELGLSAQVQDVHEQVPALTSHEADFCLLVLNSPGAKLNGDGEASHWEDDGSEYGRSVSHWKRPEELGLISCVGSYKWVPTDKLKSMLRAALSSGQVQDVAGWQDISTAPRNGTTVLLYAPGWDSPKTGWTYGEDDWQDCPYSHKGNEDYLPTHWMSLPQHPQSRRAAHEDFV